MQRYWLASLVLLAACTQEPAQVVYRGGEYYGHEHWGALDSPDHQTYPPDSPKYKETYTQPVTPAPVPAVSVAPLPPPVTSSDVPPAQAKSYAFVSPASTAAPPAAGGTHFLWPVTSGKVTLHFGPGAGGRSNDGINISGTEGDPILASADGTVVYVGNELKDYGNMVIVRHAGGWMTAYANAADITVHKGDHVKRSDVIGHIGTTGAVKTPQLHFALRKGKVPVDPEQYLPHGGLQGAG